MANYNIKYRIEYTNIEGDAFLLEIYKKGENVPNEDLLSGAVVHNFVPQSDIFHPIRSSSLDITIEASTTNLLLDFANFNEFDFKVKFYRNTLQVFEGWINPDGYFQDWVNDKWNITLQAVDGTGSLKNLEFQDTFKLVPVAPREANYLWLILQRLDYTLPITLADDINFDFGVANDWTDVKKRILDPQVFQNQNGNFLDCETVLNDLLQKYNLCISQANIEGRLCWYIRRLTYYVLPESARLNRQFETEFQLYGNPDPILSISVSITSQENTNSILLNTQGNGDMIAEGATNDSIFYLSNSFIRGYYKVRNETLQQTTVFLEKIDGVIQGYEGIASTDISISDSIEFIFAQFAFANGNPKQKNIGSDINAETSKFDAIHCNENQQITYLPAVQNFRFEQKWLGARQFIKSISNDFSVETEPLPVGYFIDGDTIVMYSVRDDQVILDPWFESELYRIFADDDVVINLGIDFDVTYLFVNPASQVPSVVTLQFLLINTKEDTTVQYWSPDANAWVSTPELIEAKAYFPEIGQVVGLTQNRFEMTTLPTDGTFRIQVFTPFALNDLPHSVVIHSFQLFLTNDLLGIGKFHDATQPEIRSTFLDKPVSIINSNEPNAIFKNQLYRLASAPEQITGLVPMNDWSATDTPTYNDLLALTSIERVRLKSKPQMTFRGDVYGFIPYESIINYDGIGTNFHITTYSYDTASNIIQIETKKIFNDNVEINHEKSYIFENESNVLIKEL